MQVEEAFCDDTVWSVRKRKLHQIVQHIVATVIHHSWFQEAWDWGQSFGRPIVQKLSGDEPFVGARFEAELELSGSIDKEILFQSPIKGDLLGFAFK